MHADTSVILVHAICTDTTTTFPCVVYMHDDECDRVLALECEVRTM